MTSHLSCALWLLLLLIGLTTTPGDAQTVHCQPGDRGCQRCSSSCDVIKPSHLPECCEAFNVCCDQYLQKCKKCSQIALQDKFFPEYCCASFTACCDQVTTIRVSPTTKRPKAPTSILNFGENAIQSAEPASQRTRGDPQQFPFAAVTQPQPQPRVKGRTRGSNRRRTSSRGQAQTATTNQLPQRRVSSRGRVAN